MSAPALTAAELAEARQRLAVVGDGRVARAVHTIGGASYVLEQLLSGDMDPASERGQEQIRSVLALVATLHERPSHAETLAARIAEAEKEAGWIERYDAERAHRLRSRAAALRAELAGLESRAAARLEAAAAPAAPVVLEQSLEAAPAEPESSLVDVDPESPAGKVAAQLAEQLGEHLSEAGVHAFSAGRSTGRLIACPPVRGDRVGHLRAIAGLLPDGVVSMDGGDGWVYPAVTVVRDGITARISTAFSPRMADEQAAARAWLAELGVEVTP